MNKITELEEITGKAISSILSLMTSVIIEAVVIELQNKLFPAESPETLLSIRETTRYLNVSRVTLSTWTKKGWIKSYKLPGSQRVYYHKKEIEDAFKETRKYSRKPHHS